MVNIFDIHCQHPQMEALAFPCGSEATVLDMSVSISTVHIHPGLYPLGAFPAPHSRLLDTTLIVPGYYEMGVAEVSRRQFLH